MVLLPAHILASLPALADSVERMIFTRAELTAEQPFASVTVSSYTVDDDIPVTNGLETESDDKPVAGDHI
jgi:hypothetical protein